MKNLTLILKTVERCNLNCSYCYFFNGADQSYKKRPKFISRSTIDKLSVFLKQGVEDLNIGSIHIVLHGGEPLMQPKEDFVYMLEQIHNAIGKNIDLFFSLQTNATLVNAKWIDLLNRYKIHVGVSFDGPKVYHDIYRVDHSGFGSYDRVVKGIKLLNEHLFSKPGCLSVINPLINGKVFYHEVLSLGFKKLDLLFPDFHHSKLPPHPIKKYGEFLISVFDEWIENDDSKVSIRKFKSMIIQLLGRKSLVYGFGKINSNDLPIISIRSDGEISAADELMSTDPATVTFINKNVNISSLKEVVSHDIFNEINTACENVPDKCSNCCWYNACGSGGIVNRFSLTNRFHNHSVYCDALQNIFAHICAYMIKSGMPYETIVSNLRIKI